jgi:RNA recognition motif-containing protein
MSTLYVGNLSWSTTAETLQAELAQYGTVVDCDTGNVRAGRTRGWAIVEMGSSDEAQTVINMANGTELEGRQLTVRLDAKPDKPAREPRSRGSAAASKPPRGGDPSIEGKQENSSGLQVVVRNLPWSVTSEMLRGTFEQIGAVRDAEVISHADSGRSKGWGTVRFDKAEDAADAIQRFGGVELAGRPMTVMLDRFN